MSVVQALVHVGLGALILDPLDNRGARASAGLINHLAGPPQMRDVLVSCLRQTGGLQ